MKPEGLNLDEFLRYAFCGISLFAAALVARGQTPVFPQALHSAEVVAVATGLAFACGAAFYSAYRACIYPVFGRIALFVVIRKKQKITLTWRHFSPTEVPQAEFCRDQFRWSLRDKDEHGNPRLYEWGSQIHLLYTLAFSVWFGSVVGVTVLSGSRPGDWRSLAFWHFDYRLVVLFFVFLIAGFVSDVRKRWIEERLYEKRG